MEKPAEATEQTPQEKSPFERFVGVRPRNISKEMPYYFPDRDFSQLGQVIGNLMFKLQHHTLDWYQRLAIRLGFEISVLNGAGVKISPEITTALRAVIEFLEAGRGETIDGQNSIENPADLVSYQAALVKLLESEPAAVMIVMSMLGEQLLDMLFFAARQDRRLGREGRFTMGEQWPLLSLYSQSVLNGKPSEQVGIDQLRYATQYLMAIGLSGRQIAGLVDQAVVDVTMKDK